MRGPAAQTGGVNRMQPLQSPAGQLISTILRHDAKVTSYKIALLRAINDVVTAFPNLDHAQQLIAIPLRVLADRWIAYYWPFVDPAAPIRQGPQSQFREGLRGDLSFRPALTALRSAWAEAVGGSRAADGFVLVSDLQIARRRSAYPPALMAAYAAANRAMERAIAQPIKYAGPRGEHWAVFAKPVPRAKLPSSVVSVPDTRPQDVCLVLTPALWATFREVSLWVEALCIHEWCLFSERVDQGNGVTADRGLIYRLLTDRPDNRRPLSWERNQIDLLLLEGHPFRCPWTARTIIQPGDYDLDHIIPLSAVPINELWNLVPADSRFNQHTKRDRLPTVARLERAQDALALAYTQYGVAPALARALRDDVAARFTTLGTHELGPQALAGAVTHYVNQVATLRNLVRF
jgi:hypothetical protein